MSSNAKFVADSLKTVIGAKIIAAGVNKDLLGGDDFPYFEIEHPKYGKLKVEVSQDEEGNGPGFLFGLPDPRHYKKG